MGDADATQARRDVVANVDEIIEHVINANMLNMPYDVYSELFDAVDGLGVEIENLQAENAKLRKLARDMMRYYFMPSAINSKQRERELLERAHELGVEEDNVELGMEVDK